MKPFSKFLSKVRHNDKAVHVVGSALVGSHIVHYASIAMHFEPIVAISAGVIFILLGIGLIIGAGVE